MADEKKTTPKKDAQLAQSHSNRRTGAKIAKLAPAKDPKKG